MFAIAASSAAALGLYLLRKPERSPLLGPPYRWLLPDCRCFYSENLYIKQAAHKAIDAYFTLTAPDTTDAQFWADNAQVRNKEKEPLGLLSEEVKTDIIQQARAESERRRRVSSVYRRNHALIARSYRPLCPALFEPYTPEAGEDLPSVAPGFRAEDVFMPHFLEAWRAARATESNGNPQDYSDANRFEKGVVLATMDHVHSECFEVPFFSDWFVAVL